MLVSLQVLMLALSLSADAFAAATAKGATHPTLRLAPSLGIALAFGCLEALAPLLGWLVGHSFAGALNAFDHWIAFAILAVLGARMGLGALRGGDDAPPKAAPGLASVAATAVGTSVDAAAVGLTLALVTDNIPVALATIGIVTFLMTLLGLGLGRFVGARFGRLAEAAGGLALIAIGAQVLASHLAG